MGITPAGVSMAGSILLLRISMDMLYPGARRRARRTEEVAAGAAKDDIAITPLGVPMLAGPGAISTALILLNQAQGPWQVAALFAAIALACFAGYWVFWLAVRGAHYLSPLALKLLTRLFGLLLAVGGGAIHFQRAGTDAFLQEVVPWQISGASRATKGRLRYFSP